MSNSHKCSSFLLLSTYENDFYESLEDFTIVYDSIIFYFVLYVGPILLLINVLAVFILTRKEMRSSYNIVFLFMAINQSMSVFFRLLVLWRGYLNVGCEMELTLYWRLFEIAVAIATLIFSDHVSWLAVIITFVRWRHVTSTKSEPSMRYMIFLCCASFVFVLMANFPLFISLDIEWKERTTVCGNNEGITTQIVPEIVESDLLYAQDCLWLRITYFSIGLFFNALPCTLLISLSVALILQLRKIRVNQANMVISNSNSSDNTRTSRMIAIIVISTLIAHVPQAIISILVGFMSDRFRSTIANKLSALVITTVMVAASCNLTIHLCMSRRFREVTKAYLCCVWSKIKRPASDHS